MADRCLQLCKLQDNNYKIHRLTRINH